MLYNIVVEIKEKNLLMKYYAVRKGFKTGIFTTWAECQSYVHGFSNAEFKSFSSESEAREYLNNDVTSYHEKSSKKNSTAILKNIAYVDGSFDGQSKTYGFGGFIIYEENGKKCVRVVQGAGNNPEMSKMRNVAGEISGAMRIVEEAACLGLEEITLYYDYAGIENWITGVWSCNKYETYEYSRFMHESSKQIRIHFHKVAGHSGDVGNDIVDTIAKEQSGVINDIHTDEFWEDYIADKFGIKS